jgi:hypothetical protein
MDSTESYVQKMEAQLKEWGTALDRMKTKADQASAETKLKMQRQIEDLKAREIAARAKLQQIKSAGQQALHDARGTIDKAWADLKGAFERARADFKD